jgi:hypothetical protein
VKEVGGVGGQECSKSGRSSIIERSERSRKVGRIGQNESSDKSGSKAGNCRRTGEAGRKEA